MVTKPNEKELTVLATIYLSIKKKKKMSSAPPRNWEAINEKIRVLRRIVMKRFRIKKMSAMLKLFKYENINQFPV